MKGHRSEIGTMLAGAGSLCKRAVAASKLQTITCFSSLSGRKSVKIDPAAPKRGGRILGSLGHFIFDRYPHGRRGIGPRWGGPLRVRGSPATTRGRPPMTATTTTPSRAEINPAHRPTAIQSRETSAAPLVGSPFRRSRPWSAPYSSCWPPASPLPSRGRPTARTASRPLPRGCDSARPAKVYRNGPRPLQYPYRKVEPETQRPRDRGPAFCSGIGPAAAIHR